jgi:hypothetical protein
MDPEARVFVTLGEYFSCNLVSYDKRRTEPERCALRLSELGEVTSFPYAYTDRKETPFTIFGAHGTFALTPPAQRSSDLLQEAIGCTWDEGFCRRWQPQKFGLDPGDPTRLTASAKFELAKGLTLDVGAQGYMDRYLGGARLSYTAGMVLAYRW